MTLRRTDDLHRDNSRRLSGAYNEVVRDADCARGIEGLTGSDGGVRWPNSRPSEDAQMRDESRLTGAKVPRDDAKAITSPFRACQTAPQATIRKPPVWFGRFLR